MMVWTERILEERPNMLSSLARLLLKVFGWRMVGRPPDVPKYLIVFAPHTSNWDLPIGYAVARAFKLSPNWIGKHLLFKPPFGRLFRWIGGIPVDRRSRNNAVDQVIGVFNERERLILAITPEGTRKKTPHWKTGFYYIAVGAQVPIQFAFLDYRRKVGGFGPLIMPSGDIEADLSIARDFFAGIAGKYPDQAGDIRIAGNTTD
jgi:1-acyl-sn-glycerol-3-phosphate acyltransferase